MVPTDAAYNALSSVAVCMYESLKTIGSVCCGGSFRSENVAARKAVFAALTSVLPAATTYAIIV